MLQRLVLEDAVRERGIKFSGGEVGLSVAPLDYTHTEILARIRSNDDLMSLLLLTDAIRGFNPNAGISVFMPYLPYARQDRRMTLGDSLSLKVLCDIINSQNYRSVTVLDPHSDVGPALLNNCRVLPAWMYVQKAAKDCQPDLLVAPDAGAAKRVQSISEQIGIPCTQAFKKRDVNQKGKIVGCGLMEPEAVAGKKCLIVDDICDGGRTFMALSQELRSHGATEVHLYVTHGIFSQGTACLQEGPGRLDGIYSTNSFSCTTIAAFELEGWDNQ